MDPLSLAVNGREYQLRLDGSRRNRTLLEVLRDDLGLTGTKCGCNTGDCGACKVLIDGVPSNSCIVLASNAVGKAITTIEGIASANGELHPLQQAFIEVGAVQCGFCTPGMIVTASALLAGNPDPDESEIRAAFDNNLCRCTGYEKIVAAVHLAAERIRDGLSAEGSPAQSPPAPAAATATGSGGDPGWVGRRLPIRDARDKVLGRTAYVGDLKRPGMLHAKILWSPHPHARVRAVDTREAEALPGVRAVATRFNTSAVLFNSGLRFKGHQMRADENIFPPVVRFIGDRVAAVAADDVETAAKAVRLLKADYEVLPAVFDAEAALEPGAPAIHEGGNLITEVKMDAGDAETALTQADLVFEDTITTPAVHHCALEPHTCVADWDGEQLTVWTSTQNIFGIRVVLSELFALPLNRIRLIKPPVGGAFGGKTEAILEPVAAALALQARRPVRLELDRRESIVSTRTRHATAITVRSGVRRDGVLTALDIRVVANTGAYLTNGLNVVSAMGAKSFMLYRVAHQRFRGYPVYTNIPVASAMRGYGSPQFVAAVEIHLDRVARELGMDPLDLRLKNLVRPGDLNPRHGTGLGNCRIADCAERGATAFDWSRRKALPKTGRYVRGMGMSCGLHGNGLYPVQADLSSMTLKMNEDGSVVMYTGTQDLGMGSTTMLTQLVGEVLATDPSGIRVVEADTELTPYDLGTYASRLTWVGGNAAIRAAEKLRDELLHEASRLLGLPTAELRAGDGFVFAAGQPSERVSFADIALGAQQGPNPRELVVTESFYSLANPGSYGAHFAEVEVDTETLAVQVVRYVAVQDVGRAINPLLVEGQIHGGLHMGLGYALTEEIRVDPTTGRVTNANLRSYRVLRAREMPEAIVALTVEEGEEPGPFGAKSLGEAATVPVAPAVINAINHALGVELRQFPATPERIRQALARRDSGT